MLKTVLKNYSVDVICGKKVIARWENVKASTAKQAEKRVIKLEKLPYDYLYVWEKGAKKMIKQMEIIAALRGRHEFMTNNVFASHVDKTYCVFSYVTDIFYIDDGKREYYFNENYHSPTTKRLQNKIRVAFEEELKTYKNITKGGTNNEN